MMAMAENQPTLSKVVTGTARMLPLLVTPPGRRKRLAAHHKVVLLGMCLLISCAMVAAIGIAGVTAIEVEHIRLAHREAPALALLLQVDRDLYQAQLGLERSLTPADAKQREVAAEFYIENLGDSERRFKAYKAIAINLISEVGIVAAYESARQKWLHTADELVHDAQPATASVEKARALFDTMRQHLNKLVDNIYQPSIEASGDFADRYARQTRWKLYSGVALALVAGLVITWNVARALRAQLRVVGPPEESIEKCKCGRPRRSRRRIGFILLGTFAAAATHFAAAATHYHEEQPHQTIGNVPLTASGARERDVGFVGDALNHRSIGAVVSLAGRDRRYAYRGVRGSGAAVLDGTPRNLANAACVSSW